MVYLYIDESGSMTNKHIKSCPYFIIAILYVKDKEKLRRVFKRFISSYLKELKDLDTGSKMFRNGKFHELKGSCLDYDMKINLAEYLCKNDLFEVFYIRVDNERVNHKLYNNTARAFNYVLEMCLSYYLKLGELPQDDYVLQIDERNVKSHAKNSLEDYLDISLNLKDNLIDSASVQYFDSASNLFIQLADFFSNFYYSKCKTKNYDDMFYKMQKSGYIHDVFIFPFEG